MGVDAGQLIAGALQGEDGLRILSLAAFEQARLNLERTAVVSPFNAVVEERFVDRGSVIGGNTAIASLVGTDECWVEAMLPADDIGWISAPGPDGSGGSAARVRQDAVWDDGVWRGGRVLGRSSTLDAQGRMVKVIVEVKDPFSLRNRNAGEPVLLVGSFVDVEIMGKTLRNAVVVERSYIHDGDRVGIMDGEGGLQIRTIDPAYVGESQVVVTEGLEEGDRLVTSYLAAPVEGMPLRLRGEGPSDGGGAGESPPGDGDSQAPSPGNDESGEVPGR